MTHPSLPPLAPLAPLAPFTGLAITSAAGRGVIVSDRDGLGLATVLLRKGHAQLLAPRVRARFGIELPSEPRRAGAGNISFTGIGRGAWLASCEKGGNSFAASLKETIGDLATISDQSDGYAVLRVTGPRARNTLAKLLPIDLHPRTFKPGDVAATLAAHVGITLWRLDDGVDGSAVFEIAVFRSLAGSFWHAISESAVEFGLVVA
jgi:sarcosine oxidase subunit gamma